MLESVTYSHACTEITLLTKPHLQPIIKLHFKIYLFIHFEFWPWSTIPPFLLHQPLWIPSPITFSHSQRRWSPLGCHSTLGYPVAIGLSASFSTKAHWGSPVRGRDITITDFKLHYRRIVIKNAFYCHRNRQVGQKNQIKAQKYTHIPMGNW